MPRSSTYPVAISGSDQALIARAGRLGGFSFRETGGSATATVRLFDNASAASGTLLATISLAAGGSITSFFGADDMAGGLRVANGVFVDVGGTGTVEGSVYFSD